jgi:hypothetical protein
MKQWLQDMPNFWRPMPAPSWASQLNVAKGGAKAQRMIALDKA